MRSFHFKILNNILYCQIFGIKSSPLCSFCNLYYETTFHIFYECERVKYLWSDLVQRFKNILILPTEIPQTAIFEVFDSVRIKPFF